MSLKFLEMVKNGVGNLKSGRLIIPPHANEKQSVDLSFPVPFQGGTRFELRFKTLSIGKIISNACRKSCANRDLIKYFRYNFLAIAKYVEPDGLLRSKTHGR
jgi:hypothetical protein